MANDLICGRTRPFSRMNLQVVTVALGLLLAYGFFDNVGAKTFLGRGRALKRAGAVALVPPPSWTISGAWTSAGAALTLVDARLNKLLEYGLDGRLIREVVSPTDGKIQFQLPSIIGRFETDYLLEDEDGHFVWLNQDLNAFKQLQLGDVSNGDVTLGAMYGWTSLGENVLAFTDIQKKDGSWASAFLLIPFTNPTSFQVLHEMSLSAPGRKLYHFGNIYLATVKGRGYFIVMDTEPYIAEVSLDSMGRGRISRKLAMPTLFSKLPELPEKRDSASALAIFQKMEKTTMPTGLYGVGNSLFVLGRVVGKEGRGWRIARLDPAASPSLRVPIFELPSDARHLTVVPGPIRWAFIERGPIEKLGEQKTDSMFFIATRDLGLN